MTACVVPIALGHLRLGHPAGAARIDQGRGEGELRLQQAVYSLATRPLPA